MDSPGLLASAVQGGAGSRPYRAEMQALAAALPGEQDLWAREGWGPGLAAWRGVFHGSDAVGLHPSTPAT